LIDAILAAAARRRRAWYAARPERRRALGRPVVSIGNLSVGGTGKTPLVAYVARVLQQAGHNAAVLSRGYARPVRPDGAVVVSDGARVLATYAEAGDEPLMLARALPGCAVVVGPDRYLSGSVAERRLRATVHVLDDGFQHLRLARTLDVVVVTSRDLSDRLLPFGRLREPLDALGAAHAVVVRADEDVDEVRLREAGATRIFTMTRRVSDGVDGPAFAFAGIARPDAFFDALERAGWTLAGRRAFKDHHRYSAMDVARIEAEALRAGAHLLVTTEKDMVRLEGRAAPSMPVSVATLDVAVEPREAFAELLRTAVA